MGFRRAIPFFLFAIHLDEATESPRWLWHAGWRRDGHAGGIGVPLLIAGAQAQGDPVGTQLRNGVRYLDLRLCNPSGNTNSGPHDYRIHHTLLGPPFGEILKDLRAYMEEVASDHELVIADLSHMDNLDVHLHDTLRQEINIWLGPYLLRSSDCEPSVAMPMQRLSRLTAKGSRVLVTYDDDSKLNSQNDWWLMSGKDDWFFRPSVLPRVSGGGGSDDMDALLAKVVRSWIRAPASRRSSS